MAVLKPFKESANSRAWRALMIVLAAVVVLSVSGYGTVIYIQLMGKVFPSGPLQLACYMGAAANFLLMLVLLVGKFVWFRPGAHEVASWLVTGTELIVAILNMMLAFQLASGPATGFMAAWGYLAPVSPIFSMCGAIALIMTSTEMRRRHKAMEVEEEKEQAERELDLAMHQAHITTKTQYVQFVSKKLTEELNSPERQEEMSRHASGLVSKVLAEMSLLQAVPSARQLPAGQFPNARTVEPATGPLPVAAPVPSASPMSPVEMADDASLDDAEVWLEAVNRRIEQERARRTAAQEEPGEAQLFSPEEIERLKRIAEAVQERGYDLETMARFLGVPLAQIAGATAEERLVRLALAADARGYSLDRLESFLGLSRQGGDAEKKTRDAGV